MADRPRFLIEFEALPDPAPVKARLKRLLKHALWYRMKCVDMREVRPSQDPAATGNAGDDPRGDRVG
jgi:hypothetical protein